MSTLVLSVPEPRVSHVSKGQIVVSVCNLVVNDFNQNLISTLSLCFHSHPVTLLRLFFPGVSPTPIPKEGFLTKETYQSK